MEQNNSISYQAYFRRVEICSVLTANSLETFTTLIQEASPLILVIDHHYIERAGFDLFRSLPESGIKIIATSSNRDVQSLELLVEEGVLYKYHPKPIDMENLYYELLSAISN